MLRVPRLTLPARAVRTAAATAAALALTVGGAGTALADSNTTSSPSKPHASQGADQSKQHAKRVDNLERYLQSPQGEEKTREALSRPGGWDEMMALVEAYLRDGTVPEGVSPSAPSTPAPAPKPTPAPSTPAPAPAPAPTPAPAPAGEGATITQNAALYDAVDAERSARGLAPFKRNEAFGQYAQSWSDRMAADKDFSHSDFSYDKIPPNARDWAEGIAGGQYGEAGNAKGAKEVVKNMFNTPSHNKPLLGQQNFNTIALGWAVDDAGESYVTFDYALYDD